MSEFSFNFIFALWAAYHVYLLPYTPTAANRYCASVQWKLLMGNVHKQGFPLTECRQPGIAEMVHLSE